MRFTYPLKTRYSETAQDGIVHHSSFVVYLEVARCAFFEKIGCDINKLEKKGIFSPVVNLSVEYKKPLYSLEEIEVTIFVEKVSKVRFHLGYQVFRKNVLVAKATSTHCFVDSSFKPIPLFKEILASLQTFPPSL